MVDRHPSVPVARARGRTIIVSQRRLNPVVSNCLLFEMEDLVETLEGALVLAPDRSPYHSYAVRTAVGLAARALPSLASGAWRSLGAPAGERELVFVNVLGLQGLAVLEPLAGVAAQGRLAVCAVTEVWAKGLESRTGELRALQAFDLIVSGCAGSVEALSRLTGRPCIYVPPSIDALAMCPYPDDFERVIDVYAMGRRPPHTHASLLRTARTRRWYYAYDTVGGSVGFTDHREHRAQLADRIRRCRYFLANHGKANESSETGDQQEIGQRFFEGAAAGAVLFGAAPRTSHFAEWFGWPDAVVWMPYDSEDLSCLEALEADLERVERIRRRNVVESLRRHDHVYRWTRILEAVGLPETEAMVARKRELESRAAEVERDA